MEDDDRSMATPVKNEVPGNSPGRNSIGKATSSKTGETDLPHYLRASTGSCHDFCKFGRQHTFDAKERRSMPKMVKEVLASPEKKKTVLPAKPLLVSKSFDSREKFSGRKSTIKREIVNDGKPLMVKTGPSISSKMSNSNTPKAKKMEFPSSFGKYVSIRKDCFNGRETKSPAQCDTLSTTKSKKVNSSMSTAIRESTTSRRNRDVETGRISGTSNIVSKKALSSPKLSLSPKPVDRIASLIARKQMSRKVASPRVNSSIRIRKDESLGTSNIALRKVLSSPKVSLSPKPVNKIASLITRKKKTRKVATPGVSSSSRIRKHESNRHEYEEVEEKTLYVIKMETGKKPQLSCSALSHEEGGGREEGENTTIEAEYDSFSEIVDVKKVIDKKGSVKKVDSPPPSKLSFRRGKVVEIQSQANSPRRLKFRQARLLGENLKTRDPRRRNLKKVEEFECKTKTDAGKSEGKIVLRHQDMQGKKDSRGLFNNVIEETASKLVETRKSKVKALVGAFETVISLQEIKPFVR